MVLFDYILIIILIFYFIISCFNGFIKEIISVLKWILSFYISKLFYKNVSSGLFSNYFNDSLTYNVVSFIIIFLVIFIISNIISKLLTRFFKFIGLGSINSLLGGILGLSKCMLIILLFLTLISLTDIIKQKFIIDSLSYPYLKNIIKIAMPYMPTFIQQNNKMFSNAKN